MSDAPLVDPWLALKASTRARIGLNRCGDSLPTTDQLQFQLAHAKARDAVHGAVDFDSLAASLAPRTTLRVHSAARTRAEYLGRPDLGRRLSAESHETLLAHAGAYDIAFVIADGLSSAAIESHAASVLNACFERLQHLTCSPVALVEQGRVAIGDEIGDLLGAELVVVLIGERPGLSTPDSLGIYVTWNPAPGRRDSERNCISNVHANGLTYQDAAHKVASLIFGARELKLTGVQLTEGTLEKVAVENEGGLFEPPSVRL